MISIPVTGKRNNENIVRFVAHEVFLFDQDLPPLVEGWYVEFVVTLNGETILHTIYGPMPMELLEQFKTEVIDMHQKSLVTLMRLN